MTPMRAREIGLGTGPRATRAERIELGIESSAVCITNEQPCPNHRACVETHYRSTPLRTRAPIHDPDHPYRQAVLERHAALVPEGFTLGEPDGSA